MRRDDLPGSASSPEAARPDDAFAPTAAHPVTPTGQPPARPPTVPPPVPSRVTHSPKRPCLHETQAMAFVAGQAADRAAIEEHIDDCAACRQLLAELVRKRQTGAVAPSHGAPPSVPPPVAHVAQSPLAHPQAMARWTQQQTVPMEPPATTSRWQRWRPLAVPGATGVLAVLLGIAIGRCSKTDDAAPPEQPTAALAQLLVTSLPVEANVVVDGRFVGVSPVERLDLDPGKHSIVIDTFGYQPYAGTVEMEPSARASLKVVLAPIGGDGATSGQFVGKGGKASNATVPPSALAITGIGTSRDAPKPAGKPPRSSAPRYTPPAAPTPTYEPPPRPRRDCSGEKSQCRDGCSRASGDCRFNCPNCVSCPSSVGWDACKRQCDSCRAGCEQNVKFCESSCDSSYNSCSASQ